MLTQMPHSAQHNLAEDLCLCVRCNDFEHFSALLSQPLVQDIVREPDARFLRRSCVYKRWKFVDVLLPYHTDEELGGVLHFCLSNPHLEGFNYVLRQRPQACAHVGRTTLEFFGVNGGGET